MFEIDEEDKERDDFFESPPPEEKPKPEKKPVLKPDDPNYWEQEESEWEHLKPRKGKLYLWAGVALIALIILIGIKLRYFSVCEEDADKYGYVENISLQGTIFQTYEGTLLPYREMMDTTRVYREDFKFSVQSDSLAIEIKKLMRSGAPVRLTYERYHSSVPWRGDSRIIVTGVERVDPRVILPPEYRPEYMPVK